MHMFRITLRPKVGPAWPVLAEQWAAGSADAGRDDGEFALDPVELLQHEPGREYGEVLGRGLFRSDILEAFVAALARSGDCLHVQMFVDAPDLRAIRWQYLCGRLDREWRILARDQRTPFSLYLPSASDRVYPRLQRDDLRALVVSASPSGLDKYVLAPFDAPAAANAARAALGDIPADILDGSGGLPTLDAVCEKLVHNRYAILHLVCHSRAARDGAEAVLYLTKPDGSVDPVNIDRWLDRLNGLRGDHLPHLAFLAACETAAPGAERTRDGVAQRMVRDLGTPAVVAMTDAVTLATATDLTAGFYRRFREHGMIDVALVEAIGVIAERHDSGVPVTFSRLTDSLYEADIEPTEAERELAVGLAEHAERLDELDDQAEALANRVLEAEVRDELDRLDRGWERTRRAYVVRLNDREYLPTGGVITIGACVTLAMVVFAGLFMWAASDGPGRGRTEFFFVPGLVGVVAVGSLIYTVLSAQSYGREYTRYLARRKKLIDRRPAARLGGQADGDPYQDLGDGPTWPRPVGHDL